MIDRKTTVLYAGIQGFFWMGYAALMGFISMYLLDHGFTNSQVGTVIAAAGLLSVFAQPLAAAQADRPGGPSPRKLVLVMMGLELALSLVLLFGGGRGMATAVLYGCGVLLLHTSTSLVNSMGILGARKPNFGLARGAGSIAYALAAMVIGGLADRFGSICVPAAMALGFGLLLVVSFLYPDAKGKSKKEATGADSPIVYFRRYPRYGLVLVGCMLVLLSHALLNNFLFQIITAKGGGSAEMGNVMSMGAIIEIPPMLIFAWMLKKRSCDFWFRITGIFFFLKSLTSLLVTTVPGFYAAQIFQIFAWGLITVSSVYYINSIMEPEDAVKGQAYYTVTLTLGNVIGSAVGGVLLDHLGVNAMMLFGTACAAVGAVFLLVFSQRVDAAV